MPLQRQTYPSDRFEIIVADNGSPEGESALSAAVADRARQVVVLDGRRPGAERRRSPGRRRNPGPSSSPDCIPDPEWLWPRVFEALARRFRWRTRAGEGRARGGSAPRGGVRAVFAFDNERCVAALGFTVTANLFCPKVLFEQVGGFRVGLSEDLDWSHRARAAGGRLVYAESAIVAHPARASWDELDQEVAASGNLRPACGAAWARADGSFAATAARLGDRPHAQGSGQPGAVFMGAAVGRADRALQASLLAAGRCDRPSWLEAGTVTTDGSPLPFS